MLAPGHAMGGRYELVHRIATGGMGDVWRCEDTVLGRAVALKVVHPAMLQEPGFAERFRAEARVMATISHPGVVSVHDYGESEIPGGGTVAYLVMEYVAGESLHEVLVRAGRLAPGKAMDLIAQAADALYAAHGHGIVHRDVKPGNLLVRPNGKLVLTDFGIARSALSGNLTQTGAVIGTASYVSPEQALGERSITPASDVYSLGVVAYQCLAGRRPFEGENLVDVAMKHIREEPPPLPADVPVSVRAVIARAMCKEVSARWPSAEAMAEAARTAAGGGTVSAVEEPTTAKLAVPAGTRQYDAPGGYDRFSRGSAGIPARTAGRATVTAAMRGIPRTTTTTIPSHRARVVPG
ncbi:MAG: serine/threonine-protein kinase [Micromonosporaceae bacterium]